MARGQILSLMGLYEWDNTIFSEWVLPSIIDPDVFFPNLMLDTAELEVLYPDPDFLKHAMGIWSEKELERWESYIAVLNVSDYDPFVNMDRHRNYSDTTTPNLTTTSETGVKAWNTITSTDPYADREQTTVKATGKNTFEHYEHNYGDSAMYSKQDIIEKEMDVRKKYLIMDMIIQDFKNRFCLQIY